MITFVRSRSTHPSHILEIAMKLATKLVAPFALVLSFAWLQQSNLAHADEHHGEHHEGHEGHKGTKAMKATTVTKAMRGTSTTARCRPARRRPASSRTRLAPTRTARRSTRTRCA